MTTDSTVRPRSRERPGPEAVRSRVQGAEVGCRVWPTWRDLITVAALLPLAAASWVVPPRGWPVLGMIVARGARWLRPRRSRRQIQRLNRIIGDRAGWPEPDSLDLALSAVHVEQCLRIFREHRPRRSARPVRVRGRRHLDLARQQGRGVILWVAPMKLAPLATKQAFRQAGLPLTHLSHSDHGFSRTPFGRRFLNPIRVAAENRYLTERIVLDRGNELRCLRGLERVIRGNGIVSIACAPHGHRRVSVPILGGSLDIASGAPALSRSTGAALLPVFTSRAGTSLEVVIDPPLESSGDDDRAAVANLVEGMGRRLEERMREQPELFALWRYLDPEGRREEFGEGAPS